MHARSDFRNAQDLTRVRLFDGGLDEVPAREDACLLAWSKIGKAAPEKILPTSIECVLHGRLRWVVQFLVPCREGIRQGTKSAIIS